MTHRKNRTALTRKGTRVELNVPRTVDGGREYYVLDADCYAVLVFIPSR